MLHYAVLAQKKEIVEMLLELGMDPRHTNSDGLNAAEIAQGFGSAGRQITELTKSKKRKNIFPQV